MTRIPHKREFLARGLRATGLLRFLERLGRQPGLTVLTYHRIVNPSETPYYAPVCSATPETFAEQLRTLRDNFRVVGLDEVVKLAATGFSLNEPTALITFDDGYRDNFDAAFPILKAMRLPATFFLPTTFYQKPRLFWWDQIALAFNRTQRATIELDRPEPFAADLAKTSREEAIAGVIAIHRRHHLDGPAQAAFLEQIRERTGTAIETESLAKDLFMSREQVHEMADSGMSIGSHTHSHVELAQLPESEQRDELERSKRILEADLNRAITSIAYPYGWPGAVDAATEQHAKEAGYKVAFAAVEGINRPHQTNPFAIKRFSIGFADSTTLLRSRLALHWHLGRSPL